MKPDKISIYDLFDRQRRYAVPLYQRQYVWTQEGQWAPLWEDISEKACLVQLGEVKAPHFLGAIVTSQRQVFGNEVGAWDIIDGQQRLTTLQIVLTAFWDVVKETGETTYDRDLQRITRNDGVMKDPLERFKVWPTNADRTAFQAVMGAGSLHAIVQQYPGLRGRQKRQTPRLAEAYVFFFRKIQHFVQGPEGDETIGSPSDRVQALFETLRRYLHVVNIELEADDDPQVIFESLNGRGIPLLPSDLIRNFVFIKASRGGADLEALYSRYWRTYDERRLPGDEEGEPWWKQDERQGRINRPRLDLFLFHYVQYTLEREANIGHLFQEFRNWWDQCAATDVEGSLAAMQRYSEAFVSWMAPTGSARTAEFSRWLKALDTSTVYPLMFFFLVEAQDRIVPSELEGIVDDLESYLVRRAICGLTNKQYNRSFVAVLRNVRKSGQVSRATLRAHLGAGTGDSVRWPTDDEFGRAFVHRPVYRYLKREVTLMVLRALERALMTSKHEQVEITGKLSIEHFMPQSWEGEWPLTDDSDEARERRDRVLHTFGNLALVTPQFNTSLSNRGLQRKQRELKRITRLLLNRELEDVVEWNERGILSRGRDLFDIARRRWPHPASPEKVEEVSLELMSDAPWKAIDHPEEVADEPPIELLEARVLLDEFAKVRGALTVSIDGQERGN